MSDEPADVRADLDSLLDALIRFAQEILEKHGEFYPFAATVTSEGTVEIVGADPGQEHPESQQVIDLLYAGLEGRVQQGGIRAAGVCLDVRLPDGSDAIQVSLEHVMGDPMRVFLPYKRRRLRGLEYGQVLANTGDRRLFSQRLSNGAKSVAICGSGTQSVERTRSGALG